MFWGKRVPGLSLFTQYLAAGPLPYLMQSFLSILESLGCNLNLFLLHKSVCVDRTVDQETCHLSLSQQDILCGLLIMDNWQR